MQYKEIKNIYKDLHKNVVKIFSKSDRNARVNLTPWNYKNGGGGESAEIMNGEVIEKGAVNFSGITGKILPGSALATKVKGSSFKATGISIVIHPNNPFVPCSHLNVRYFELSKKIWWFGGGFDLTPYFPFESDIKLWHMSAKQLCAKYDKNFYKKFKNNCDEYFYLKHRKEKRGVGGIFFDNMKLESKDFYVNFTKDVVKTYVDTYLEIVNKRKSKKFNQNHKDFQLYRRGRYVEFNLLYDRGTLFGLQSSGRVDSILMSMPPVVKWSTKKSALLIKYENALKKYL